MYIFTICSIIYSFEIHRLHVNEDSALAVSTQTQTHAQGLRLTQSRMCLVDITSYHITLLSGIDYFRAFGFQIIHYDLSDITSF